MNLDTQLTQLESAQLVRPAFNEADTFLFKHALTQDAAYQSLLVKQRREIHRLVAQAYEAQYGAQGLDDYAGILAKHFDQAGDETHALSYAIRAGDQASRKYATAEAIAFYTHAIEIARRADQAGLQELYLKRGRVHELCDHYASALENYNEMEQAARVCGDRAMELAGLIARATVYSIPNEQFDMSHAKALSAQALDLTRALGDQASEAKILWNLVLVNSRLDTQYHQAIEYGERAIAIARALGLREQLGYLLNDVCMIYVWLGEPERGNECNLEARAIFRELNNLPMLTDNLGYAIMRHITIGENAQAIEISQQGLEISRRIGNVWGETFNESWVGEAYREMGEIDQAIQAMEHSIQLAEHSFQAPLAFTRADLAALYGDLGQVERGLELTQLAVQVAERVGNVMVLYCAGQITHLQIIAGDLKTASVTLNEAMARVKPGDEDSMFGTLIYESDAELQLALGNPTQAILVCEQLIHRLHSFRLHQHLATAIWIKGRALMRQHKFDEAWECLQEARAEAESTQSRWMLWRILAGLAEIEIERGKIEQANALCLQARENLGYIIAHTPDEFRQSFLNLPQVRAVMETQ